MRWGLPVSSDWKIDQSLFTQKKVIRNFSRKMLLIEIFFCMVHCFGQCHNVQWYEMHKMCNFSKSHWSFANIWGVFPFKKCAINRLYQIFTSKIFKGPLLGNKSKQVPSLTTLLLKIKMLFTYTYFLKSFFTSLVEPVSTKIGLVF